MLDRANAPLSAQEVREQAAAVLGRVGLATVYRALKAMLASGEVVSVEIAGSTPRFELSSKGHHHHAMCVVCRKVWDLEGCAGGFEGLAPRGFVVTNHELTLFGRCKACSKAPDQGTPARKPAHAHHH